MYYIAYPTRVGFSLGWYCWIIWSFCCDMAREKNLCKDQREDEDLMSPQTYLDPSSPKDAKRIWKIFGSYAFSVPIIFFQNLDSNPRRPQSHCSERFFDGTTSSCTWCSQFSSPCRWETSRRQSSPGLSWFIFPRQNPGRNSWLLVKYR